MDNILRINPHGGIVIRDSLVIDGHEDGLVRVVSHVHSDHTKYLGRSARKATKIIGTPVTLEWLNLLGYRINESILHPLRYGERIRLGCGEVLLVKAYHIPGTAQVVCEDDEGLRIVYTSDFKKPGTYTPVVNADIVVTDAVYGNPSFRRVFDDYIDIVLVDLVKELLSKGPVWIHGYYGKTQEVMMLLRKEGIDAPFIMDYKQYALTKALEKHGFKIGDYHQESSPEADAIIKDGWYIFFTHFFKNRENGVGNHIKLSGWEFRSPLRRLGHHWWLVAFSDHSDFQGLITYIQLARPKAVVVNSKRSTDGELFTNYLTKKLGVKAYLLP